MFKVFVVSVSLLLPAAAIAHEGHDHGPGQVQAQKGGIVDLLEEVRLELLVKGKTLQLFIYDTEMKPTEATKYPVSATVTLPRKKAEPIRLSPKGDHWAAEFDAKGAHRYTLEVSITQGGHDDKVKFTVEPKK